MINLILFGSFFVMLLLNIPIAVSLGMSSIFALLFSSSPLTVVPTNVYSGMAKFLLLAIPFFVLSGNIVDGQDVFAVYEAAKEAVARARAGEGPTFIEAKTYRIEGHFVGDPELYRDHAETQKIYHDTDPLKMFRAKAAKLKLMTAEECDAIDAKCEQKIKDAKEYAMQSEYADASEYMKYVYVDD